jgi:hypothetical protein
MYALLSMQTIHDSEAHLIDPQTNYTNYFEAPWLQLVEAPCGVDHLGV